MRRTLRQPRAFANPQGFRAWIESHTVASEIFVRCFKAHASYRGMTYRQALDQALCLGWIDGVRHGLDEDSVSVRFTPRQPKSAWSSVNARRVGQLQAEGRMRPAGLAAFRAGVKSRYSFESRPRALAPSYLKALRANERAWRFFEAQAPWYRRTAAFWVMSAKRPETRARRLDVLIACSKRQQGVPPLARPGARSVSGERRRNGTSAIPTARRRRKALATSARESDE
jgi:uncharacterized protein YdeI (YjbR/CyaY-like superfamily)